VVPDQEPAAEAEPSSSAAEVPSPVEAEASLLVEEDAEAAARS
jgi:hypothetical protein